MKYHRLNEIMILKVKTDYSRNIFHVLFKPNFNNLDLIHYMMLEQEFQNPSCLIKKRTVSSNLIVFVYQSHQCLIVMAPILLSRSKLFLILPKEKKKINSSNVDMPNLALLVVDVLSYCIKL